MSRAWSWRNAILATNLQATTKHVLMVISTHMNDMGGGCYPSVKSIAELASLSERSVCTHIDIASEAGWLAVEKHGFNGQGWARHEYKALWPEGTESLSVRQGTERRSEGTEPNDKKALNVLQSIELSIEHPKEHHKSKPTKASRRGSTTAIRLEEFLHNSGCCPSGSGLPPREWGVWAHQQFGWDANRVSNEWAEFSDYWTSGNAVHGGRKADWPATWRSHCRRSANRGGSRANGSRANGGLATAVSAVMALRHGGTQAGSGVDTGETPAGTADADGTGTRSAIGPNEIPF